MNKNISIREIAQLAGVGVSTVSRVLNHNKDVSEATRERVLKIIEENNYVPNGSARSLKASKQNHIGLLVKGLGNPFFDEIIGTVAQAIEKHNHTMVLHFNTSLANDFEAALQLVKEKNLCGIICLGGNYQHPTPSVLQQLSVPMVVVSSEVGDQLDGIISSVSVKNDVAAYQAVSRLIDEGAKKVGLIAVDDKDSVIVPLRIEGYRRALLEFGLSEDPALTIHSDFTLEGGYTAMKQLLIQDPLIDSVFVISDIMAVGAIKACHEMGKRVPEDLQIIGFDGLKIGGFTEPSLSTVNQRGGEMGLRGVDLLFQVKDGRKKPQTVYVDTELWVRGSSL